MDNDINTSTSAAEPPIWFLFGLSGAGKSYVGDLISRHTGWPVYHADADLTDDMRQALAEARPFTDAMRDVYFARLPALIRQHQQPGLPLIVTQGAYKQRHRDYLRRHLPQLSFVWVDAPQSLILQRLARRRQGIGPDSAAALFRDFEPPLDGSCYVHNDGEDAHVLAQCGRCISGLNDRLTAASQVI
jgi:gluconokinase